MVFVCVIKPFVCMYICDREYVFGLVLHVFLSSLNKLLQLYILVTFCCCGLFVFCSVSTCQRS